MAVDHSVITEVSVDESTKLSGCYDLLDADFFWMDGVLYQAAAVDYGRAVCLGHPVKIFDDVILLVTL